MASNPPSGASRLPDILSFWSFAVNSATLLVSLMTFWKENGGSLLGHGVLSLRREGGGRTKKERQWEMAWTFILHPTAYILHFPKYVHFTLSLLLGGSHVRLGLNHFVNKLPKANGGVIWQVPDQPSYRKYNKSVSHWQHSSNTSPIWCHFRAAHIAHCPSSSSWPNHQPWSWRNP